MVFIVTSHSTLIICFNCKSLCLRWYIHKTVIIYVTFAEEVCENQPTIFYVCSQTIFIHPSTWDIPGPVRLMKTALLSVYYLLWLCSAPPCSAGPSKTDLTSPNCVAMKPYHSVQISIPLLGEILFQAITLHQGDVIATLRRYCPRWPVSSAVPLRQKHTWCTSRWTPVMQPQRTIVQWSKSLNGACIEISSLFFRVKCIKHHSLDEMLICWNGVAYKVLIKTQSAMNHLDTVIFPTVCVEYARFQCDWHGTNDPCPLPFIFAARSVYETPQITALVDPRCSNPQRNCEGLYGEPCQLPWGATDLPRPTPTNPSGRTAMGKDLSLLIITSTSHQWHRRWIIPVNPFPWCREAMFVYIDRQHMWHSCCRQRLALAEVCSRFPLATVQLAGKTASSTHSTNQYKQWSSKSRIMSEQTEMRGRMELLIISRSEIIFVFGSGKMCFHVA